MPAIRFNVSGLQICIEKHADGWRPYYSGSDGKKRAADCVIPGDIEEGDLGQYLADLFHEHARPGHADVVRMD